jgi:pyridoxal phosphate enzyme (YggS family)
MESIEIRPEGIVTRITKHLDDLQLRIGAAAEACGRDVNEVTILAVSKRQSVDAIHEAGNCGLKAMGENYVQEALGKMALTSSDIEWHFIGQIQSNKSRDIAENFDWVHTVTNRKIAERLSRQRPDSLHPLNICIQVCTDPLTDHAGCASDAAADLCHSIAELPGLKLRGLMTLPYANADAEQQRIPFRRLRELSDEVVKQGLELDTLSMGMSNDLEAAVMEGSTLVRIGTALFGPRPENLQT